MDAAKASTAASCVSFASKGKAVCKIVEEADCEGGTTPSIVYKTTLWSGPEVLLDFGRLKSSVVACSWSAALWFSCMRILKSALALARTTALVDLALFSVGVSSLRNESPSTGCEYAGRNPAMTTCMSEL